MSHPQSQATYPPHAPRRQMRAVPFTRVAIDDVFWSPRIERNRTVTLPAEYRSLKETGRIDAFDLTWTPGKEPKPHYFWDSDVAKWVEAASYSLATHPDPELESLLDEVVGKIVSAQQPDGYLNVYFTVVEPGKRWKNLGMWHELYCAGHLIEAAVAHYQATGKRRFLDAMIRYADYIDSVFGPGKREGYCGHQEIELALVRLYHVTGEPRYLRLSKLFLDRRGRKPSAFFEELAHLSPDEAKGHRYHFMRGGGFDTSYAQDHLPVREQTEVVGHAVRAMYMYCGMTDVGSLTGDEGLLAAVRRLWKNLTRRRMYVTGGIGPARYNEGFTRDYDLPNREAYAETCAAIGLVFWAHRLLLHEPSAEYADVLERALYNGVLSGISLDGSRFFYENPLESAGDHHRKDWYDCACCPPNIARLLASLGSYVYSEGIDSIYVHLYVAGSAEVKLGATDVRLRQETRYPWDGKVRITLDPGRQASFDLALRIPGWCRSAALRINGAPVDLNACMQAGYAVIRRHWQAGDTVELDLAMPVERVYAHPEVEPDVGRVALQRGPIVYCLEAADHEAPLHRILLPRDAALSPVWDESLLGGVVKIEGSGRLVDDAGWDDSLYRTEPPRTKPVPLTAIPYYAWDNRSPGAMRVWISEYLAHGSSSGQM